MLSQYLADHGWIAWIIIGLIAGAIAKAIMPGRDPGGCLVTILLGIAGALVAGFLAAIVGACIILLAYRLIARR